MLYTTFTNEKIERRFSRIARVESDFKSQLSRDHLSVCFLISEGGRQVTDAAIELWYSDKFWRNGSTKHKYTKKKATKDCQIADTAS